MAWGKSKPEPEKPKPCTSCGGEGVQYFYGKDGKAKVDTCKGCGGRGTQ